MQIMNKQHFKYIIRMVGEDKQETKKREKEKTEKSYPDKEMNVRKTFKRVDKKEEIPEN